MIDRLQFMNQELWWAVVLLAITLVLLFLWKEWKGEFNTRFFVHSVVGVVGIVALGLLYLRPTLLTEVSGKAVVLTDNYRVSQLDSLKDGGKSIQTIRYRPGLYFSKSLDSINEILVLGDGLRDFDFWQLKEVSTTYLMGTVPKGIVKLKYEITLRIGDDLLVNGLFNAPNAGNRLVLESPSGEGLDSIVFRSDSEMGFKLNSNLKATGTYVYRLSEKDSTGTVLNSNPLPVEVLAKQQLRIFISNRFPSFESKYLKNFLAEEGHEVVVRSQITKGRYKFEYFNTKKSPVYGFRENELRDFDLVILDADTYLSLSKSNKNVLLKLLKDTGLGILVQPNASLFRSTNALVGFEVERDVSQKFLKIDNSTVESYPYSFQNTNPLGIAIENHSYAMILGKGRFGTTGLSTTYQLVLDGKKDLYRNIWTAMITATAKSKETIGNFEDVPAFSVVGQPTSFSLSTSVSKPSAIMDGAYSIPLMKNTLIEDKWHGRTYPKTEGWHLLQIENDTSTTAHYFVTDTIYWKSLTSVKTIMDNSRFFDAAKNTPITKMMSLEISRWWFFLIFIGCMGYLWVSPKLKA